jgi:hypothetical protein
MAPSASLARNWGGPSWRLDQECRRGPVRSPPNQLRLEVVGGENSGERLEGLRSPGKHRVHHFDKVFQLFAFGGHEFFDADTDHGQLAPSDSVHM